VFFAIYVNALVRGSVIPGFKTLTMLLIFFPFALITSAVQMRVNSKAFSFIVFPLSVVYVAVRVDQAPVAGCFASFPVTFVD
jgi:hypothetical protein